MIALLLPALLVVAQDDEAIPPTPYDRVIELEITADDEPLIEGKGPTVVYEYEVEFSGTLHVWTKSEIDLFLRVEEIEEGSVLAEDDDSGGGRTPYLGFAVEEGAFYAVLVVSSGEGDLGSLELHLVAAPETQATLDVSSAAQEGLAEVRNLQAESKLDQARTLVADLVNEVLSVASARHSEAIADAIWNLAFTSYELGDPAGALELFEHVHSAEERLLPANHRDLLSSKLNLAAVRKDLGDLAGALELEEQVHAARERLLPPDHLDLLAAKQNLAVTRGQLGDLVSALELEEQVHAARERLQQGDHPDLLAAKLNLAATRKDLGDLAGALELEEHVHAAWERLLPSDHLELLAAKQNLAVTRGQLGDLVSALELEEQVHAARERLLPPDHPDLLAAKLNLAGTRKDLGDLAAAQELEEYVYAARERLLPPDHPDLLKAKAGLANTRKKLGDIAGALELEEQVHAARERLLPPDHPDLLKAKANLAGTRKKLGDIAGALELEEQVHAAWQRLLPPDHLDLLTAKQNLAVTLGHFGELVAALELEEHVHAARERLLPPDHPDLLRGKLNLANARRMLGDLAGALEMTRSLLGSQLELSTTLQQESSRVARARALRELHRLPWVFLFIDASPQEEKVGVLSQCFSALEGLRQASVGSAGLRVFAPALAQLQEQASQARRKLNDLCLSPPALPEGLPEWREEVRALVDERDRLERELRTELAEAGLLVPMPSVESVAAGLQEGSALVSFYRFTRYFDADPNTGEKPRSVDSVLAYVVSPDATVTRVNLGPSEDLEGLASAWLSSLGRPLDAAVSSTARGIGAEKPTAATGDNGRQPGEELRRRLIDPCLEVLGEKPPTALHLILDDFLYLVPVSALPMGDGKALGEVIDIRLEVSTARLLREQQPLSSKGTLVALGGVDYDAKDVEVSVSNAIIATPPTGESYRSSAPGSFDALTNTAPEVEALAGIYRDNLEAEPLILEGPAASKAALHELAPRARYLHIATHGWFAPQTFKSMIDSAEEQSERDLFMRAGQTLRGFAPETLCGLALAGANHGTNSLGKVPGIITAEELATLDLSNCELAVLSACETNVGIRRAGQGIQSLQAALHAAGARTAITSLWRVDDAATRRLMELFYTKLWKDGLGKADALWQAKMALRDEGHPVGDWAGWVLTGDPD